MKYNVEQKKAIKHEHGPLLVVAGAGTGKTSVLIGRLLYLIKQKKAKAEEILLISFTEKASYEIESRVDKARDYGSFDSQIYTFHGLADKILKEHGLEIGLPLDYRLINSTEQWILIQNNLDKFNLNYFKPLGRPHKFIAELIKYFSRLKDENISSKNYLDLVEKIEDQEEKAKHQELAGAYIIYNQLLLDNSYLDFGDLIFYSLKLLKERKNILKLWQNKFKYIMVDEFQDTNLAQYQLIKLLSLPSNNLMVVGDDDQAIYKFRGASLANIMQFKEDFKDAKEVILIKNYRSQADILKRAYNLIINNNPYRLEEKLGINKQLEAQVLSNQASNCSLALFKDKVSQLDYVALKIKEISQTDKDFNWSQVAVLSRSNLSAELFSQTLTKYNIPNYFLSLKGLYRKEIILNCLAYFRVLIDRENITAWFRLFNLKTVNLPYNIVKDLLKKAKKEQLSFYQVLLKYNQDKKLNKLITLIEKHQELLKKPDIIPIFFSFIKDLDIIKDLDHNRDQEQFSYLNQFYQKIKDFSQAMGERAYLNNFVDLIDWEIESGDSGSLKLDFIDHEAVSVMTVHSAKGLEFKYVFLVDLVEGKFPSRNLQDKISMPDKLIKEKIETDYDIHIAEERRLFYVAMTRAKEKLFLSASLNLDNLRPSKVSRFLKEAGFSDNQVAKKKIIYPLLKDLFDDSTYLKSYDKDLVVPDKFSFSQLAAYSICPLQYKYAFILKIPVLEDKASLNFGRLMHNCLQEYLQPLIYNRQLSLFEKNDYLKWSRLKTIYKKRFNPYVYANKKEADQYYKQGENSLKKFSEQIKEKNPKVMFLEKSFNFKIKDDIIKGTIDRVDLVDKKKVDIIDYKTGNPKEKLNYQDKRQLILYQIFLENNLKIPVNSLNYYYLNNNSNLSFVATEKEKDKLITEVLENIKEIKAKSFPARPSMMCSFCDYKDICPFREI
jgi:DNA helicase II / ATP-dependent DNA helicase PcrA